MRTRRRSAFIAVLFVLFCFVLFCVVLCCVVLLRSHKRINPQACWQTLFENNLKMFRVVGYAMFGQMFGSTLAAAVVLKSVSLFASSFASSHATTKRSFSIPTIFMFFKLGAYIERVGA